MFVELLPLLRNRTVSLSVAVPANGDSIVLTIMPKVTDEKAEEFGAIKEAAVIRYVGKHDGPNDRFSLSVEAQVSNTLWRHSFEKRWSVSCDHGLPIVVTGEFGQCLDHAAQVMRGQAVFWFLHRDQGEYGGPEFVDIECV